MKFTAATVFALATAVLAVPNEKRSVDPASASLALFGALPSSLQTVALTNPAAAASEISSEFLSGTPTWFTKLPTDVQTYFLTAGAAGSVATTIPLTTGTGSGSVANATGKYSNTTTAAATTSAALTSSIVETTTAATSAGAGSTSSSSTSTGGASLPTGIVGAGLAGALGLIGMLAL